MPTVPQYGGPQLDNTPLRGGYQQTPSGDGGAHALARGLGQAGDAALQVADQNNRDVALRTESQVKEDWIKFEADLRTKSQGRDAVGYTDKVKSWWDGAGETYGKDLTPAQKQIIGRSLTSARVQALAGATDYEGRERDRSELEAFKSSQLSEIQRAAASGDPAVAAVSSQFLRDRNAKWAATKGLDAEQLKQLNLRDTTALHVNMLQGLQQSDPKAALEYFNANKAEIDGTRHAEIAHVLGKVAAGADGEAAADEIWGRLGPKGYNQPIDLMAMEADARKRFANDKPRLDAALQQLKERKAAFNSSEAEANAGNVNTVMARYASGPISLAQLERLPEFQALPGKDQATIRDRVDAHINTIVSRAAAQEGRADAAESRAQRALERKGYAEFLRLSDPAVLSTMSEAQVQAQLPVLGNALTAHLAEKFRSTRGGGAKEAEAKMDTEDFNHLADQFGLKPYEKKSDDEKANLGELKYRVEQVIYQAQQTKGKSLTRDEKNEVMRQEMARTVKVSSWWGMSSDDKPVIALKKEELDSVVVPKTDRAQIVEALKAKAEQNPNDKRFAPTEENVRTWYLRSRSRAGNLFPTSDGH
jgi:hypothetical protein